MMVLSLIVLASLWCVNALETGKSRLAQESRAAVLEQTYLGSAVDLEEMVGGNTLPASQGSLKFLHYNLGWECMSAWRMGTGKTLGWNCVPGEVPGYVPGHGGKVMDKLGSESGWIKLKDGLQKVAMTPSFMRKTLAPELAEDVEAFNGVVATNFLTSCSRNMLLFLQAYQKKDLDVVTMVELCNPGQDGSVVHGFQSTPPKFRQCSTVFFDALAEIFTAHKFLVNIQTVGDVVTGSLTIWKQATFGEEPCFKVTTDFGLGCETAVLAGRPITAVGFSGKKVMILNVHSIHYRKMLIQYACSTATPDTFKHWDVKAKAMVDSCVGQFAPEKLAHRKQSVATWANDPAAGARHVGCRWIDFVAAQHQGSGPADFAGDKFPTQQLQEYYGGFLELLIAEDLIKQGWCTSLADCNAKLAGYRVIVGGDFNDETGELIKWTIFGHTVSINPAARKRTCCSDRDEYYTVRDKAFDTAEGATEDDRRVSAIEAFTDPTNYTTPAFRQGAAGVYEHTEANFNYLIGQCQYAETKKKFQSLYPNAIPDGAAPRKPPASKKPQLVSRFPFASDLILDSTHKFPFASEWPEMHFMIPEGYLQDVENPMSDHDPVAAGLAPL